MSTYFQPKLVRWDWPCFEGKEIPDNAKQFLVEVGLPMEISFSTFEFGIFDSEGPELVIGVDYEAPIIVRASGIVEMERADGCWFFNSSVQQLGTCIGLYEIMKHTASEGKAAAALSEARQRIEETDPACTEFRRCVWRTLLDDFQTMAL